MDTGITAQMQDDYRRNGIVKVEQLISRAQAAHYREATLALLASTPEGGSARYGHTFHQYVDVWRDDETLRGLTLHPRIGAIAEQLAGIPMRLWHDHTLAKEPAKAAPTAFHQDQMKWPFAALASIGGPAQYRHCGPGALEAGDARTGVVAADDRALAGGRLHLPPRDDYARGRAKYDGGLAGGARDYFCRPRRRL